MPPRVLAVVARYLRWHTDYLRALAAHADLTVAVSGEVEAGSVDVARAEGLRVRSIGTIALAKLRTRLAEIVDECRPDIVHLGWYGHEQLTVLAREVAPQARIVFECRDPLTTLLGPTVDAPGPQPVDLERAALEVADAHVFVNRSVRDYLAALHGLDLSGAAIVPQGAPARTLAPPSPKLSAGGRPHVALLGTASTEPATGRCYLPLIPELVGRGLAVHSHFLEPRSGANDAYRELARALDGYVAHDEASDRDGTAFSRALSQYDLVVIAYDAGVISDATLAVVMPMKAAAAWAQGAIPVVTPSAYRGVVEWIDAYGLGFVADSLDDLVAVAHDRAALARATDACLAHRAEFTHEAGAATVAARYEQLV